MSEGATVLSITRTSSFAGRHAVRVELRNALRNSESPVIVDLTGHRTLDHEDINLLLDCVEQAAGGDTPLFLVAGSHAVRVLLEVTRISSLVPVFSSMEEALNNPCSAIKNTARDFRESNLTISE